MKCVEPADKMQETEINATFLQSSSPSVTIRNAYKRYSSSNIILNGLNLTVPDRSIYGLLGPSGCGKTTLLNCMVGKTKLDAGTVKLKVKKRIEIGYMPQSVSLHDRMTILENFFFYGFLYGMTIPEIISQANNLISFLDLPSGDCFVCDLSGGQQRRVSLAIALIHDPKIIILDEPTVGLDPILNHSIWKLLLEMAQKGKSIIVTTHYIQEAGQAHTIGLMREGKLLAEASPLNLTEKCCCTDLEKAFFILSHEQESTINKDIHNYPKKVHPGRVHYEDDEIFSKKRFKAILYKNLTLLKREYAFIVFVVVLPILQSYLFNVAFGGRPTNLPIAVVNEEIKNDSCNSLTYDSCFLNEEENQNIASSCLYLEFLRNRSYNLIEYSNDIEGLNAVKKNKVWALLHFTQNYTLSLANKVSNGRRVSMEDLTNCNIQTWIDLSNQYIGNLIKYDIYLSMFAFLQQIMINCDMNPKITSVPIKFEEPVYGSFNESFLKYASSALLCLCCFFLPMVLSAGLILTEKIGGMMERMLATGVTMAEIILSAVTIQVVVHFIQTALSMMVMYWWFDNPLKGSLITLCSLMMLTGISGMSFGFMIAVMNKDMMKSFYFGMGLNLALCLTSGLMWPVEAEHYLLKSVTWLLPLTWTVDATRAICSKSYSFFHPHVLRGFGSTIIWNVITIFIIYLFVKYKRDSLVG